MQLSVMYSIMRYGLAARGMGQRRAQDGKSGYSKTLTLLSGKCALDYH